MTAIVSLQVGAAVAGRLFGTVPVAGVTGLRLWSAAVVIGVVGARGVRCAVRDHPLGEAWRDWVVVGAFGVILGVMNYSIYQAFARIPLGIAVTIEFLGPLAVAVVSSRRVIDLLWVALAGAGVLLGQVLAPREWLAVGCVVAACAGTARTARAGTGPGPAGPGQIPA